MSNIGLSHIYADMNNDEHPFALATHYISHTQTANYWYEQAPDWSGIRRYNRDNAILARAAWYDMQAQRAFRHLDAGEEGDRQKEIIRAQYHQQYRSGIQRFTDRAEFKRRNEHGVYWQTYDTSNCIELGWWMDDVYERYEGTI